MRSRTAAGAGVALALVAGAIGLVLRRPYATSTWPPSHVADAGVPSSLQAGTPDTRPHVVVFTDYQCPACAELERTLGPALRARAGQGALFLEVRHFPLPGHRRATRAAVAAICGRTLGAGFALHESVSATRGRWTAPGRPPGEVFDSLAGAAGLDPVAFRRCTEGGEAAREVAAHAAEARRLGVASVPGVYVDGRAVRAQELPALLAARGFARGP